MKEQIKNYQDLVGNVQQPKSFYLSPYQYLSLPSNIPLLSQPTLHLSPVTCIILAWEGHKEVGQDQRREMVGFRAILLRAGALLLFFSCLLCSSSS